MGGNLPTVNYSHGRVWPHGSSVAVLSLFLAGLPFAGVAGDPASRVELRRVPGGGLQPQVVVAGTGVVHLVCFRGEPARGDLFYLWSAGGDHFSEPLRVNSRPGNAIAVGTIRGAHLAVGRHGRVHVAWNGHSGSEPRAAKGAPMLYARLNDSGTAFEREVNLLTCTQHLDGGGSVAADTAGNVVVAWHAADARLEKPDEAVRAVWMARSVDEGKTFAAEVKISPEPTGACACCGLRAGFGPDGMWRVLYRGAQGGLQRDVLLLQSATGLPPFALSRLGPWRGSTCPMSSMTLAPAGEGVMAAWETGTRIEYAALGAVAGRVQSPGGTGRRKHPGVARNARGETLVAWAEGTGWNRGGAVAWELKDAAGATLETGRQDGLPVWSLPAVYARGDGTFRLIY